MSAVSSPVVVFWFAPFTALLPKEEPDAADLLVVDGLASEVVMSGFNDDSFRFEAALESSFASVVSVMAAERSAS